MVAKEITKYFLVLEYSTDNIFIELNDDIKNEQKFK